MPFSFDSIGKSKSFSMRIAEQGPCWRKRASHQLPSYNKRRKKQGKNLSSLRQVYNTESSFCSLSTCLHPVGCFLHSVVRTRFPFPLSLLLTTVTCAFVRLLPSSSAQFIIQIFNISNYHSIASGVSFLPRSSSCDVFSRFSPLIILGSLWRPRADVALVALLLPLCACFRFINIHRCLIDGYDFLALSSGFLVIY